MIEPLPRSHGPVMGFRLSGKLHDDDYKTFVPAVDRTLADHGTVRILAVLEEFHGWDAHALWDDIQFAAAHINKVDRIAIVGETTWEKWMSTVCKPFTRAQVRYFDQAALDDAWSWVEDGVA